MTRIERSVLAARRHMLWALLAAYAAGAALPGPALAIRRVVLGTLSLSGGRLEVGIPLLMLALLLFDAGFASNTQELRPVLSRPWLTLAGVAANVALPLAAAGAFAIAASGWPEQDEVQAILAALALVAGTPIAGASATWAENARGNVALSLALIVGSTLSTPWTTPAVFRFVAPMTTGDLADDLRELAAGQSQLFLAVGVVAPSLAGILARAVVPAPLRRRTNAPRHVLDLLLLLGLAYVNAGLALPGLVRDFDADFFFIVLGVATVLCAAAFGTGTLLGRILRASPQERTSLTLGVGMNNNGSGLVLAATALAGHPRVAVPIIVYNLVQQIGAAIIVHGGPWRGSRRDQSSSSTSTSPSPSLRARSRPSTASMVGATSAR